MKKQIIILGAFIALTLAFVQAADAHQSLVATGYTAPIERLMVGEQLEVEPTDVQGGLVHVDTDNQVIELTVQKTDRCEGALVCTPKLNNRLNLRLPIVKIERDNCGVLAYTAQQETTSGRQIINVRDNSTYNCRNFMMLPKTTVSIVKQSRAGEASAVFAAGLLEEAR